MKVKSCCLLNGPSKGTAAGREDAPPSHPSFPVDWAESAWVPRGSGRRPGKHHCTCQLAVLLWDWNLLKMPGNFLRLSVNRPSTQATLEEGPSP